MTAPLPPPPSAAERDRIASAHDRVIGSLDGVLRIPPDVLDDLRWMADSPHAIVTMSRPVLRRLLQAYDDQVK